MQSKLESFVLEGAYRLGGDRTWRPQIREAQNHSLMLEFLGDRGPPVPLNYMYSLSWEPVTC